MSAQAKTWPTLVEIVIPDSAFDVRFMEALCLSLLTGLSAQIEFHLPWSPVPVTGQTFMVLLTGALLGRRWGMASMAMYLAQGCAGLPVFAGGAAGFHWLLGPTGGYLLGFVPAAWLTGRLAERGWGRSPLTAAAAMAIGSSVIFAFGLAGLARFVPSGKLFALGLFPFIPGDLAKVVFASAALPFGWKLLDREIDFSSP